MGTSHEEVSMSHEIKHAGLVAWALDFGAAGLGFRGFGV